MIVRISSSIASACFLAAAFFAGATLLVPVARAQDSVSTAATPVAMPMLASVAVPAGLEAMAPAGLTAIAPATESSSVLPDDPATVLTGQQDPKASLPPTTAKDNTTHSGVTSPMYAFYIPSDEAAQHLTSKQKIALGFRNLYAPLGFAGVIVSAGYSHVTNGAPNYGTNGGAFGQRLGAAELRSLSQGIFTDVILHPIMHTDARYYVKGPNYGFASRTKYAVTRIFVTKKDDGGHTVNSALLLGYLEAASMTRFYYPTNNKTFKDLVTGYGGSLGGAALGFVVSEFSDSFLKAMHFRH